MPDMTGWSPVTTGDGTVLGWMAPADVETPRERALRRTVAGARADAITELAAALGEECFDPEIVWDTSALPEALKDAAFGVAITLVKIEETGTA